MYGTDLVYMQTCRFLHTHFHHNEKSWSPQSQSKLGPWDTWKICFQQSLCDCSEWNQVGGTKTQIGRRESCVIWPVIFSWWTDKLIYCQRLNELTGSSFVTRFCNCRWNFKVYILPLGVVLHCLTVLQTFRCIFFNLCLFFNFNLMSFGTDSWEVGFL